MYTKKNCLNCNTTFYAKNTEINRGYGKFCSKSCSSKFRKGRTKPKASNVTCAYCQKPFYKKAYSIKHSKNNLFFCCREHKDLAQRLSFGLTEIHPNHYGVANPINGYRRIANEHHDSSKCDKCGYDSHPILQVHHKDCDRTNNNPANLQWLCPTCHEEEHFLTNTGRYAKHLI